MVAAGPKGLVTRPGLRRRSSIKASDPDHEKRHAGDTSLPGSEAVGVDFFPGRLGAASAEGNGEDTASERTRFAYGPRYDSRVPSSRSQRVVREPPSFPTDSASVTWFVKGTESSTRRACRSKT